VAAALAAVAELRERVNTCTIAKVRLGGCVLSAVHGDLDCTQSAPGAYKTVPIGAELRERVNTCTIAKVRLGAGGREMQGALGCT